MELIRSAKKKELWYAIITMAILKFFLLLLLNEKGHNLMQVEEW